MLLIGVSGTVGASLLTMEAFKEVDRLVSPPPPQPRCAHVASPDLLLVRSDAVLLTASVCRYRACSQSTTGAAEPPGTSGTGKRALTTERTSAMQFNALRTNLTVRHGFTINKHCNCPTEYLYSTNALWIESMLHHTHTPEPGRVPYKSTAIFSQQHRSFDCRALACSRRIGRIAGTRQKIAESCFTREWAQRLGVCPSYRFHIA